MFLTGQGYVRYQSCPNAPGGLPGLLVMPTDAEADLAVGLKAAVGGHEAKARRTQGVCRRQDDSAVVDAIAIDGVGGAS